MKSCFSGPISFFSTLKSAYYAPIKGNSFTFPIWEYKLSDMRVITTKTINAYRECYPEADGSLKVWVSLIEGNEFKHFAELKNMFGSADFVKPDRVIFVKWFGWHKDYNKINPSEVQHEYPPC